jgi:uncharacterized protein (UPF0335 family)
MTLDEEEELDKIWQHIAKVEITAIKAASTSSVAEAKLRVFEQKVFRLIDENSDLRERMRKLMPDE